MLRTPCVANLLSFCAAACSLCVFSNSSVEARPARNTTPAAPTAEQALIRTDLTPRNKNECLAVAQTLDDQVRRLSQQSKHPNKESRESSLGLHPTLISHAARGISKRHGSALSG
jgi:hypothetical protein